MKATKKCQVGPENGSPAAFQKKVYAPILAEGRRHIEDDTFSWRPEEIKTLAILSGQDNVGVGTYTDGVAAVRIEYFGCLLTLDSNQTIYRFKVSLAPPERVGVRAEDYGRGIYRGSTTRDELVTWGIRRILDGQTEITGAVRTLEPWDIEKEMPFRKF